MAVLWVGVMLNGNKHPMQPVVIGKDGCIRFQENAILRWLVDSGHINLNEIALMHFDDEDRMQLAQLIGYTVSGFGDLSFADPVVVAEADEKAKALYDEGIRSRGGTP